MDFDPIFDDSVLDLNFDPKFHISFYKCLLFLDLDSDPDILREIPHLPVFSEKAFTQTGLTLRSKDEEVKKDISNKHFTQAGLTL